MGLLRRRCTGCSRARRFTGGDWDGALAEIEHRLTSTRRRSAEPALDRPRAAARGEAASWTTWLPLPAVRGSATDASACYAAMAALEIYEQQARPDEAIADDR